MQGFSYKRLERIMNTEKPFRGTTNRFPLGSRKANLKNFYVREENGVIVFDITCGTRWHSTELSKEEYDAAKATGDRHVHEYVYSNEPNKYMRFEHPVHILGTSRPDDRFEFTAEGNYPYGQGEKKFLSENSRGYFVNDTRRGGMVWKYGSLIVPIFKGFKASTHPDGGMFPNTELYPDEEYVVIGKKVNRKVGKEILAGYEHFYKVSETMCKAMDRESFLRTAKEVLDEGRDGDDFASAEALRDQAPLDAMILYASALDVGSIQRQIMHPNWHQLQPIEIFENLKRTMNTRIYREHPEVFTSVHYKMGEKYPPSIWGYEVEVNGNIVQQY